jgi:hypothetical protein
MDKVEVAKLMRSMTGIMYSPSEFDIEKLKTTKDI